MKTRLIKRTIIFISAVLIIGAGSYAFAGHGSGHHGGGYGNDRGAGYHTGNHMGGQSERTGYGYHMNEDRTHFGASNQGEHHMDENGYHRESDFQDGKDGRRGNRTGTAIEVEYRSYDGNQS